MPAPNAPRPRAAGPVPAALVYVIGDSISLHYGPDLERLLPPGLRYSRKRAEPGLAALAAGDRVLGAAPGATPITAAGAAMDTMSATLDYPEGAFGANAGDSGMVLAYLQAWPPAVAGADIVLLNCGLHDLKISKESGRHQVPPGVYRENLRRIAARLTAAGKRALWVTTTPVHDTTHERHGGALGFRRRQSHVEQYNDIASAVMGAAGIPQADLHAFTLGLAGAGSLAELYDDHVHFTAPVRAAQAGFLAGQLAQHLRLR